MSFRGYKYRIYPNPNQMAQIDQTIDACRLVYNLALEVKQWAYLSHKINLSAFDIGYQLVDLKNAYPWLKEVDSQALQASINKLDGGFRGFFKGNGYPRFKSKHRGIQSFQCQHNTRKIDWGSSTLRIPKIKDIPIVLSQHFEGKIKTVTISRTPTGKYFASILVEQPESHPIKQPIKTAVGIDLGINNFLALSDGTTHNNPKYLRESIARLKVLQRRASRKKKGSANRKKANLKVALLHERITNKRLGFIHKVTSRLVNDNQVDTFIMEDLNVKGMMANHSLAQAISDVSWGKFKETLKYKCDWTGKNLLFIDRFAPSSKKCSGCGYVKGELSLDDRTYHCEHCGHVMDRDVNAAINIKNFGLSGQGMPVEPVEMSTLSL